MGKYKAVIFDLDGTMLNTRDMNIIPLQRLIKEELGKNIDYEDLLKYLAFTGKKTLGLLGFKDIEKSYEKWVKYVNEYEKGAELFEEFDTVIKYLYNRGILCGIASSKLRKQYEIDFLKTGLEKYMKGIVLADDTKNHKPHPEALLKSAKLLGIEPKNCIYIGDTKVDREASRNAGMGFGLAVWGAIEIDGMKADYMLEKPIDIIKII